MVELIKEVASVVRDLETLRLIEPGVVTTVIKLNEKGERVFRVGFRTTAECTALCNEMFETVRQKGYVASPIIFDANKGKFMEFEFRKK